MAITGPVDAPSTGSSRLVKIKEIASLFDVTDRTIRLWIDAGKFPAPTHKVGRSPRWDRAVVDSALAGTSTTARAS